VEALQPGWLSSHSGVEFYGSVADYLVALGDVEGTRYCERRALDLHRRVGYQEAIDMMTARIEACIGDPTRAIELLDAVEVGSCAQPNTRWVRQLERALALSRLGDAEAARVALDEAMAATRAMGVADLPIRFEAALLERIAATGDDDRVHLGAPDLVDDRVVIEVLGGFVVRRGSHDATPPDGHPSTLVKLVALQRTITVDALIDTLWPDADAATGRARLRNTMNRLRSRSGDVVERVGQTLVLGAHVVTDLDRFEAAAARAFAAPEMQRVGLARQAVSGYNGQLLPGDLYEDWAAAPRERLTRRFVALVDLIAAGAEAEGGLDDAARWLDIGIDADPLDEHRYARLAAVLAAQGRGAAARQVAERAECVFSEMGIDVGPTLRSLLDQHPSPARV
jgi:DNA-binding SARP family transcriptional activator